MEVIAIADCWEFYPAWFQFKKWAGYVSSWYPNTVLFNRGTAVEILGYLWPSVELDNAQTDIVCSSEEDTETISPVEYLGEIVYPIDIRYFNLTDKWGKIKIKIEDLSEVFWNC